jgi:hypothetical protein
MKIVINLVAAAALSALSAPAFAHGGGMGGMGHGSGTTVSSQSQDVNGNQGQNNQNKTQISGSTTHQKSIFQQIEIHHLFEEDLRVEREIVKLIKEGLGNSPEALALHAQDIKLAQELVKLGFNPAGN